MPAQTSKILSGRPVAALYETTLKRQLEGPQYRAKPLTLVTVQTGDSADMRLYAKSLGRVLARFNIEHQELVCRSNADVKRDLFPLFGKSSVTGIMIFSPVPDAIDAKPIFLNLPRKQDVEGRTFIKGNPFGVFSPTAKAAVELLKHLQKTPGSGFEIRGKHAVMVGHSDLVGKPTAMLLADEGATVTVCHKDTKNIQKHISDADILVVAIGKPGVIRSAWIKKGAVVVDVGENVLDGKVVGDIDFDAALEAVSYISPVPGGVGPLTNLMVIDNLITLDKYKDLLNGSH